MTDQSVIEVCLEFSRAGTVACDPVSELSRTLRQPRSFENGLGRVIASVALLAAMNTGCQKSTASTTAKAVLPPEVMVVSPSEREYTRFEEFTGRLEASEVVEIRARVNGYLDQVLFKDGSDVNEGDLLAIIDPRTYETEVARMAAGVQQAKSRLMRLHRQLERGKQLVTSRVVTQEEFDLMQFDHAEAEAALQLAEANEKLAQLNLDFTKIRSPVKGKISRRLVDQGNLVKDENTFYKWLSGQLGIPVTVDDPNHQQTE